MVNQGLMDAPIGLAVAAAVVAVATVVLVARELNKGKRKEKDVPAGLETFDDQGRSELNLTTRTPQFLGQFTTTNPNGSLAIPEFAGGNGFAMIVMATDAAYHQMVMDLDIRIQTSSWGVSWQHISYSNFPPSYPANYTIIYGVY